MQQFRATSHQEMRVEFISHFSPTHTEEAFCCMKIMRSKCELCDVNLLVGEPQRRIAAHRLVLASCSPYFLMGAADFPHKSDQPNSSESWAK